MGRKGAIQVATGLNFPTSVAFDDEGNVYIAESGLPLAGAPAGGRVSRTDDEGRLVCLKDQLRAPVNGITYEQGRLYIAEGGAPGRISTINLRDGSWEVILDGLPGGGNYHTNVVAFGPDGKLYFGQGSATNSAIIGPDSLQLSWLRKADHPHDIPGRDVVLTGFNAEWIDPSEDGKIITTGAFQPFGVATAPGQRISGTLPCTSAIMRCDRDGSNLELVAWGLRNPYGLVFLDDGRLLAIDLGLNDRGSRPVGQAPSALYQIENGTWYGWPDFAAGVPVSAPSLEPVRGSVPHFLLANHDELGAPAHPLIRFAAREAPTRIARIPGTDEFLVTLFGDKRPVTGPEGPREGRKLVNVNLADGSVHPVDGPELERPIDIKIHPITRAVYVVDFGEFELKSAGEVCAKAMTGTLWKL